MYRDWIKGKQILLSSNQAGPSRTGKQLCSQTTPQPIFEPTAHAAAAVDALNHPNNNHSADLPSSVVGTSWQFVKLRDGAVVVGGGEKRVTSRIYRQLTMI